MFGKKEDPIKELGKDTQKAIDWIAAEYEFLTKLDEDLKQIEESTEVKVEEKAYKKAWRALRYISRSQRKAAREVVDVEEELKKLVIDYPEFAKIEQEIEISSEQLVKAFSLYAGEFKKDLAKLILAIHKKDKLKENVVQDMAKSIEEKVEILIKWVQGLEVSLNKVKNINLEKHYDFILVGYGSLMNGNETMNELKSTLEKAGTPITDMEQEFKERIVPVWVLNYQRVFNKVATRRKWETEEDVSHGKVAVLNIVASRNHKFNGVGIKLTQHEFKAIKEREKNYGVIHLKYVRDYRSGTKLNEKCIAVKSNILNVPVPNDKLERIKFFGDRIKKYPFGFDPDKLLKTNKMPIPRYIKVIDKGVRLLETLLGVGGMYKDYLKTTYCYFIDRKKGVDHGEITLEKYYSLAKPL